VRFLNNIDDYIETMMIEFHELMHEEGREEVQRLLARAEDTGDMEESIGDWVNGKLTIPANGRPEGIRLGSTSGVVSDDEGFNAVNKGRRRQHYPGFSKMGGSVDLPHGVSNPAADHVLGKQAELAERAIAAADRSFGR